MSPTTGAATDAATGHCPVCGQPFTSTPRQRPRRRYCSERCRKTAWRHRHPGHRSRPGDVPPVVPHPRDVSPAVSGPDHIPDPSAARPESAARCPHCARPITVIALLVVPAAAHVTTPEVRHG
jgi:endogenous inhibitor of DNA gyrase (YacG/DUF329 family)